MKLISDGSDLEGVEKPQDIKYMKWLRSSMWIIDSWPKAPNESQFYRYFMTTKCAITFTLAITYLRHNVGKLSAFELGHTYITVCMNTLSIIRSLMVMSNKYNQTVFDFMNVMHLYHFRNKSDFALKTHILVHKISHAYTIYVNCIMWMGMALFNLTPLYNNYASGMFSSEGRRNNGTFEHSVYYYVPFDSMTSTKGYLAVTIYNWYVSYTCSSHFCIVDLTIGLIVFHIWGHLRLLTYNFNNFPRPASLLTESKQNKADPKIDHKYTEEETKVVHEKFREYIHHHSLILDFLSKMSDAFGEIIAIFYLFNLVAGCLLLLMCSPMDTKSLMRYGLLTLIVFQQMIQVSVIFELLGSSNDKVIDAVYCLPWEYMETKHRKLVFLMLKQSQQSINLKAMSMITVGVQSMISIIKTSFSYFIMLRTIAEDEPQ